MSPGQAPPSSFGPTAILTPANAVTLVRVALTPILLAMILGGGASWPVCAFWIVLAATDGVDGYIARRQGTTRSGAFLDPLADKLLVLGALWSLVVEDSFWWLPVALITGREAVISLYRSYAGRRGVSIPARWWAKVKTVVQEVAVGLALLPLSADHAPALATGVLWAAVALAIVTGVQYLLDAGKAARAV